MPSVKMPRILPLTDDEAAAILAEITLDAYIKNPPTDALVRTVADYLDQFVRAMEIGRSALIDIKPSGSQSAEDVARGIWIDRTGTRLQINSTYWHYATVDVDMNELNDGPLIFVDPAPIPKDRAERPGSRYHEPAVYEAYAQINVKVQIIERLLDVRGYGQIARGQWIKLGSLVVKNSANPSIGRPHLASSFRDSLHAIGNEDDRRRKVSQLFRTFRTVRKPGFRGVDYAFIGKSDAMNFVAARDNGMISYLPIKKGQHPEEIVDPWARAGRQEMKPGRFVRAFFSDDDLAEIGIEEKDIEQWANAFIGEHATPSGIEIVHGAHIKHAYLGGHYARGVSIGDLKSSCMRYDHCQPYLDIYAENPAQIGLAIVKDGSGRYAARGLVWTDDNGRKWYDRIYGTESMQRRVAKWLADRGYANARGGGSISGRITVKLDKPWFSSYPYMDTFHSIYDDGTISNSQSLTGHGPLLATLRSTNGAPNLQRVICTQCHTEVRASSVQDGVCKTCRLRAFTAWCDKMESADHDITQITSSDLSAFANNRAVRTHSPDGGRHQVVTIRANNHHWLASQRDDYRIPITYRRITQEEYDELAREELERLAEIERKRIEKEAQKQRVRDELARGEFPGTFDVPDTMGPTDWGWHDARNGVAWLKCTNDVRMRVRIVISRDPQPTEIGYMLSLEGYSRRTTIGQDEWETLPATQNPLEGAQTDASTSA